MLLPSYQSGVTKSFLMPQSKGIFIQTEDRYFSSVGVVPVAIPNYLSFMFQLQTLIVTDCYSNIIIIMHHQTLRSVLL